MTTRPLLASLFGLGLLLAGQRVLAAPLSGFTARYEVTRNGSPMGTATLSLQAEGHGVWIFDTNIQGTAGLAALLGASIRQTSRFRWRGDLPEAISYDYQLNAAIKHKQSHLQVDWSKNQVATVQGKEHHSYPARPGIVERNTTPLALGLALRQGKHHITLPVAVKQEVQTQTFEVAAKDTVKVPAGTFHAERVDRTDADRGFSAWYVPARYPVPVELSQHDGGTLVMKLVSFTRP